MAEKRMIHSSDEIDEAVGRILDDDPLTDIIDPLRWLQNETTGLWEAVVSNAKITGNVRIDFWPADVTSVEAYTKANVYVFSTARVGSFTLMAKNKPEESITLNYTLI